MGLFSRLWKSVDEDESSGDECEDNSAGDLSYVGKAAYEVLRKHHNHHHHELWNVTKAKVVGEIQFTPRDAFTRMDRTDPEEGHDDWFPKKIGDVMRKTQHWCDVLSLAPPDGKFLAEFKDALAFIVRNRSQLEFGVGSSRTEQKITIRMMFGNLPIMPLNCNALIKELTKDLPPEAPSCIKLWVGSWRKDVSWNHAKIVAVDGKYLWTGGHNFWDKHYLRTKPVNDLSLEMEGGAAADAHRFANGQWGYILKKQNTAWGRFVDKNIHDSFDVPRRARVTVSEYPPGNAADFPPKYHARKQILGRKFYDPAYIPVITMGRYGTLLKKARPSDDGMEAMLLSARKILRMALQDLGPVLVPGTKSALPGLSWPHKTLNALARVMYLHHVDVEIVLSNPSSIPGDCSPTEANYGNGWSCVDVAAEIIKHILKQFPDSNHGKVRTMVECNLRVCFLRSPRGNHYKDGQTLGLHSKHFIVDDICCYIGSQNLYICDLAEWGVVIDDEKTTRSIKSQYWDPMWKCSYIKDDCEVDKVMDGLNIHREAENGFEMTKLQYEQAKQNLQYQAKLKMEKFRQDSDDETTSEQED